MNVKIKALGTFSTWDSSGIVSGSEGEVLTVKACTAEALVMQGLAELYEEPKAVIKKKKESD